MSDAVLVQLILAFTTVLGGMGVGMLKLFTRTRELKVESEKAQAEVIKAKQEADAAVESYKQSVWQSLEEQRKALYKDIDEKREGRISELREQVHDWRDRTHVAEGQLTLLRKEKETLERRYWELEGNIKHLESVNKDLALQSTVLTSEDE